MREIIATMAAATKCRSEFCREKSASPTKNCDHDRLRREGSAGDSL
jgi:hypothetical protein